MAFGADAAFAKPEIYKVLRGVNFAIRIPANDSLGREIAELLRRPVGRPSHKPVVWHKSFLYQAASWKKARRVVKHASYYWLLLAEGHLSRSLFGSMLRMVAALPLPDG